MKAPLFVRALTGTERTALRTGLRSPQAFTLSRSQLLLLSAEGKTPRQIARQLGCSDQTVRNVIRVFEAEALACLEQKSSRPQTATPELDEAKCEKLRDLLHQSPRQCGKARSTWTLHLVAEVAKERGLTTGGCAQIRKREGCDSCVAGQYRALRQSFSLGSVAD